MQVSNEAPEKIEAALRAWYGFPSNDIHCQVATCADSQPSVRTMKLYDVRSDGSVVFLSRTDCKKWQDIQHTGHMAICLAALEHGQIVAEGSARLLTIDTDKELTTHYWQAMDLYAMKIYSPKLQQKSVDVGKYFGVIIMNPSRWEIFEPDVTDYLSSSRCEFLLKGNQWQSNNLAPR